MQKSINRGFTLIELLVVIAIIGILASIVLVSLGNARQKGSDAGIQANLSSMRTQAEVYSGNNSSSYGTPFAATTTSGCGAITAANMFSDPTIKAAVQAAETISGFSAVCAVGPLGGAAGTGTFWQIAVPLKTAPASSWCVSSNGVSKQVNAVGAAALAAGSGCLN